MEGSRVKSPLGVLKWLAAYKYVILAVLLGVVLLLLPDGKAAEEEKTAHLADFDRTLVQREMEGILSAIDGAGRLRLMLTVGGGGELELAQDRELTQKQGGSADEYSDKTETVVLGSGSSAEVVVTQSRYPEYVGALVVCEGGGSAAVRLEITQALCALTGLPSDRISVIKGRP